MNTWERPHLTDKEGVYIENCYKNKTGGDIPDPWMHYPFQENWNTVIKRLLEINSGGSIWADSMNNQINCDIDYEKRDV